jgi:hypothetical protein
MLERIENFWRRLVGLPPKYQVVGWTTCWLCNKRQISIVSTTSDRYDRDSGEIRGVECFVCGQNSSYSEPPAEDEGDDDEQ